MAETIQDVFWIATPGIGKTVYVSPGFEYIWGRTREALYRNPTILYGDRPSGGSGASQV